MGETIGMGILDSGCVDTVCGESWFQIYNESLSLSQRKSIRTEPSNAKYRFGSGPVYICKEKKFIPVHIGSFSAVLGVNIVKCDVPLLISRKSLKSAECTLDFSKDSITLLVRRYLYTYHVLAITAFLYHGLYLTRFLTKTGFSSQFPWIVLIPNISLRLSNCINNSHTRTLTV